MKDFQHFNTFDTVAHLQRTIQQFATNLQSRHLSISKFLQLSSKTSEEQQNIYQLLTYAIEVEHPVDVSLQKAFTDSLEIGTKIGLLHQFSTKIISDPEERENALREINHVQETYKDAFLDAFEFTSEVQALYESAKAVRQFGNSELFQAGIAQIQKVKPIKMANSQEVCIEVIESISMIVNNLLQSLECKRVEEVLAVFANVEDWRREIIVLRVVQADWDAGLQYLHEGLQCYHSYKKLKDNCLILLNLQKTIGTMDLNVSRSAEKCIISRIEDMKFGEMIRMYNETVSILYPEGDSINSEPVFEVLAELQEANELISFLQVLSEERLKHLLECVNDHDESVLTAQLIIQLESVWHFFSEIKNIPTCNGLVSFVSQKLHSSEYFKIKGNIRECSINIRAVMDLTVELEKKEEAKRKQIEAFYKSSVLSFIQENDIFVVSAQYSGREKISFNLSYLHELKDRASLSLHAFDSKEDDSNLQTLQIFVELVTETQRTIDALIDLYDYGYPINISDGKKFSCIEGNFQELREFQIYAAAMLQEWKNCIEDCYKRCYPLTFLFGRQFWILEKYLYGKHTDKDEAESLLAYMHRSPRHITLRESSPQPRKRLIKFCDELNQLRVLEIPLVHTKYDVPDSVPVKARIKCPQGYVLYISVAVDRVLGALVSAYLNSGRQFPQAHQVMHCSRYSQWPELQAFLYRCLTSPKGEMFTLIGPEKLPLEIQTALRNLFDTSMASGIGTDQFSLAVISCEDNSLLSEYFQMLGDSRCIRARSEQVISDEADLGRLICEINISVCGRPTIVVRSDTAGQGKSTWVQKQADALNKPLRKLPIAGDLDLEQICHQLLDAAKPERVLLLLLSHVDSVEVLDDLLTCICLMRSVKAGNLVMTFPSTCTVFIEVQNLQPVLSLPFLNYLTQEIIQFDINHFESTKESEIVVAYLHLYDTKKLASMDASQIQVTTEMAVCVLNKYFLEPQKVRGQLLSFHAIHSFISVLYTLITRMELSAFSSDATEHMAKEAQRDGFPHLVSMYRELRMNVIASFLETCEEVTTRCVAHVRDTQVKALENVEAVPGLVQTLTWKTSNHFSMIFFEDGSHIAIYRKQKLVPLSLKKLIYLQFHCLNTNAQTLMKNIIKETFTIPDYKNLDHRKALEYLQVYTTSDVDLVREYGEADYVVTQDNFLKMNLIYLRMATRLPIIIMGETGCGKTSLIRFFVEKIMREHLVVINIHAGTTSQILKAHVSKIHEEARGRSKSRLWVFFDEFNTSNCVGQICEMLCERTFSGEKLPSNIVLLAACNPFRVRSQKVSKDKAGIKKSARYRSRISQNLMHMVKPLPETVIEYMWDFGALKDKDSRKYIESMLQQLPQLKGNRYEKLFTDLVYESQKYYQEFEDVSSVSLRDVMRFKIFYEWFEISFKQRKSMREVRFRRNCEKYHLHSDWSVLNNEKLSAGVLALCNCYYYRLVKQEQRRMYLERICSKANGKLSVEMIEAMLRCNEDDFLARMELPEATALNQAFRENISCLLHCILCKIALFICGKPGCSKSLAVQLVFSNLRGHKSVDPYFQSLPELVMVPFQGSESCTSEGIEKVFERANRFLKDQTVKLLPVVVFDEIGLAEISKNNPLKVLHSLLELENRSVGFVGVSNWRLDASKMNRAMYLARPDPDCEQLKFTAKSIFSACKKQSPTRAQIELIEVLAIAYFKYKEELKGTRDEDFFGLRDFYSLIKQASSLFISDGVTDLDATFRIVKYSVERNFGGKAGAASRIIQLISNLRQEFKQFSHLGPTPTIDLINGNLQEPNARYLMLICKGDVATYAIDRYIKLPHVERRTLVGSHMRDDEGGEEYAFRSLSDIILYMERGISVILKDMDHVYSSLYDLFNQNFALSGDSKYCRVALGAQFNPRCFVHNNFRVIVFMRDDDEVLEQTDAPFLNRFEKHRFDIEQVFKHHHKESFERLQNWTESLTTLTGNRKSLVSISHVFPLYSLEYLKLMILYHDSEGSTVDSIVNKCKEELLKMASQEVVLHAEIGTIEPEEKAYIQEAWENYHRDSFISYLSTFSLNRDSAKRSLVFLYNTDILQNDQLSQLQLRTYYQSFSSFQKEQDIVEDILKFYRGSDQLYILDVNLSKDREHFVLIKFIVEKISKEMRNPDKKVCVLVRLMRNVPINIEVCWFDLWDVRTFTSCREKDFFFSYDVMRQTISDLVKQRFFYDFEGGLGKLTLEAYQKFMFKTEFTGQGGEEINDYIFRISEQVATNPHLVEALCDKMKLLLPEKQWLDEVLYRPECVNRASNIFAAISYAVDLELAAVYPKVLYAIDKFNAFHSFFTETDDKQFLQQLWLETFESLKCDARLQTLQQSNRLSFSLLLDFPFIKKEYDILRDIFEKCEELPSDQMESDFLKKFVLQSILKCHLEEINTSRSLQNLYFHDFILIDLTAQRINIEKDFLMLLHECWSCDQPNFESKVWKYVQNRSFGLALCEVIAVLRDLKIGGFEAISERLINFPNVFKKTENEDAASELRRVLKNELKEIVGKVTSTSEWLKQTASMQEAALLLNRLFTWISCLDSVYEIFLENYDEIDILALCFQVLSRADQTDNPLQQLQKSIEAVSCGPFLYDKAFSNELFSILQSRCSAGDTHYVISGYLFKLLLYDSVQYLPMIVEKVNTWQLEKCCSSLVAEVAMIAGLITEDWRIVIEIEHSSFTDELERLLKEGSTKFSVLLCDAVYWYMKRILRFDTAEEAATVVSGNFELFRQFCRINTDCHASYTMKVQSSAFLRCYLEAYCKVVHEEIHLPPGSEVSQVSDDLDFDWASTLRVYAVKYWKQSEKLSVPRLKKLFRERSTLLWTRNFTFPEQFNEAIPCEKTPYYHRTNEWMIAALNEEDIEPISDLVNAAESSEMRVTFATVVMMNVRGGLLTL